jgi:hypothetical protein
MPPYVRKRDIYIGVSASALLAFVVFARLRCEWKEHLERQQSRQEVTAKAKPKDDANARSTSKEPVAGATANAQGTKAAQTESTPVGPAAGKGVMAKAEAKRGKGGPATQTGSAAGKRRHD